GEQTWKKTRELTIAESEGRFPRPPIRGRDDSKQSKATEEVTYKIEDTAAETAVIHKKMELKTAQTVAGKPRIEIQGEGKITFDQKSGGVSKLESAEKLIAREGNSTEETPVKITCRLLTEAERAELAKRAEAAARAAKEPLTEAQARQALDD